MKDTCRRQGISGQISPRWPAKPDGMGTIDARRMHDLESEDRPPKPQGADPTHYIQALKAVLSRRVVALAVRRVDVGVLTSEVRIIQRRAPTLVGTGRSMAASTNSSEEDRGHFG